MAASITLDALDQRVLRALWPDKRALIETTTGAGSTTSLVIAARANSSHSVNAADGVGIYCPSVTASTKESYVTRGGLTVASGTYTMSPAYGSSPGSSGTANAAVTTTDTTLTDTRVTWTVDQWIGAVVTCDAKTMTVTSNTATVLTGTGWSGGSNPGDGDAWTLTGLSSYFLYGLTMFEIDDAINNIVRSLHLPRYVALSLLNDGNMEGASANVATDWPDSTGTPTQTKEKSIILTGTQSLKLVIATLDDSVRSQSLPVTEGDVFKYAGASKQTAGSLRHQIYDVTNAAEIIGTTVGEEDWTDVRFQAFSIPSDCQNIQVR